MTIAKNSKNVFEFLLSAEYVINVSHFEFDINNIKIDFRKILVDVEFHFITQLFDQYISLVFDVWYIFVAKIIENVAQIAKQIDDAILINVVRIVCNEINTTAFAKNI